MVQTWVVTLIFGAFALGVLATLWSRLDRLDAKIEVLGARLDGRIDALGARIDAQGQEIRTLAEHQCEMTGEQRVLREMAHTHSSA
ncbi:MAG: hypothetical protein ACYCST_09870 [Acidimicrobiales bacterium]